MHPLPGKEQQTRSNFRKATLPIFMAGNIVHDLFTVFISKTLPSAHFVYETNRMVGRARRASGGASGGRALPESVFRNRAQDQIAQPIRMRDALAISPLRFY